MGVVVVLFSLSIESSIPTGKYSTMKPVKGVFPLKFVSNVTVIRVSLLMTLRFEAGSGGTAGGAGTDVSEIIM